MLNLKINKNKMKTKNIIFLVFGIIFIVILSGMIFYFLLIKQQSIVKNKAAKTQKVENVKPENSSELRELAQNTTPIGNEFIKVTYPLKNEKVGGRIYVTGIAKGTWYFEGSFPAKLVDQKGNILVEAPATAEAEWMKEDFVPFAAELRYQVPETTPAKIILEKDNPSDDRSLDAFFEIPVTLEPKTTSTKLFFTNSTYMDRYVASCSQSFSVARAGFDTMALGHQTLEKLLEGPTPGEKELGYGTAIPEGVKILSLDMMDKIAKVDLSKELLNMKTGTNCEKLIIIKQITDTLKQFSGIEGVEIKVEGKTDVFKMVDEGPRL